MKGQKLNLGCGTDIRAGYVNIDSAALAGVDRVLDIARESLPFPDESCEEVLAQDVLEHLDYLPVLAEIHRVLAPSGRLVVRVPHYTSRNNAVDPTHCRRFSCDTFEFFLEKPSYSHALTYYTGFHFFAIERLSLTFPHGFRLLFFNRFVGRWVNKSRRRMRFYELSFLSGLFPAENIELTLIK